MKMGTHVVYPAITVPANTFRCRMEAYISFITRLALLGKLIMEVRMKILMMRERVKTFRKNRAKERMNKTMSLTYLSKNFKEDGRNVLSTKKESLSQTCHLTGYQS